MKKLLILIVFILSIVSTSCMIMTDPFVGSWSRDGTDEIMTFTLTTVNYKGTKCSYTATAIDLIFSECADQTFNGTLSYTLAGNRLTLNFITPAIYIKL